MLRLSFDLHGTFTVGFKTLYSHLQYLSVLTAPISLRSPSALGTGRSRGSRGRKKRQNHHKPLSAEKMLVRLSIQTLRRRVFILKGSLPSKKPQMYAQCPRQAGIS